MKPETLFTVFNVSKINSRVELAFYDLPRYDIALFVRKSECSKYLLLYSRAFGTKLRDKKKRYTVKLYL